MPRGLQAQQNQKRSFVGPGDKSFRQQVGAAFRAVRMPGGVQLVQDGDK